MSAMKDFRYKERATEKANKARKAATQETVYFSRTDKAAKLRGVEERGIVRPTRQKNRTVEQVDTAMKMNIDLYNQVTKEIRDFNEIKAVFIFRNMRTEFNSAHGKDYRSLQAQRQQLVDELLGASRKSKVAAAFRTEWKTKRNR